MDLKVVLVVVFIIFMCPVNGLWWALGSPVVMDPTKICRKSRRLRSRQIEICKREPKLVQEVLRGAHLGTKECQFQFRNRRWNCSTDRKSVRKLLLRDTRETGFVNAVTTAGVTFAVTQACTSGYLQCTCARQQETVSPESGWKWAGCGDNIAFGYKKSREFMDTKYKKKSDVKTLVTLHNNEAGRLHNHNNSKSCMREIFKTNICLAINNIPEKAVKSHMKTECKCHGLSGSCVLRACWRKMPSLRDVSTRLKERFDGAAKVIPGNDGTSIIPHEPSIKTPGKDDLVYSEDSPNFCHLDRKTGSLGTRGRECNSTSPGVDGCDLLCCQRGFRVETVVEKENCRCRFKWCCEVTCDTCDIQRIISRCN